MGGTVHCVAEEQLLHDSPTVTSTETLLLFSGKFSLIENVFPCYSYTLYKHTYFPKLKEGSQIPMHRISQTTVK